MRRHVPSFRRIRQAASAADPTTRASRGTGHTSSRRRHKNAPPRAALAALAVTAAAVGGGLLATSDNEVVLVVDGQLRHVSTHADTVADLLDQQHVDTTDDDLVVPAPETELEDGTHVKVIHARDFHLNVNGSRVTHTVTANTVGEALDQLDLDERGSYVSRSLTSRIPVAGTDAVIRTPQQVHLHSAGTKRTVSSTAATVRQLLAEHDVAVDADDIVRPALDSYPQSGDTIRVVSVMATRTLTRKPIPAPVIRRETASLDAGDTQLERAGRAGVRTTVRVEIRHDGKVVDRRVIADRVKRPIARVVLVGTRPLDAGYVVPASSSAGGPNWAALAACESGGNPRIVSANGLYHGLYQFSVPTWVSVGGSGLPSQASPAEQTMRAQMLYARSGSSPWPVCGSRL